MKGVSGFIAERLVSTRQVIHQTLLFDVKIAGLLVATLTSAVTVWNMTLPVAGAVAVPGDYDGNGRADLAAYRATGGLWYIRKRSGDYILNAEPWGFAGTVPVAGDYDGDGRSDLALFDPATGRWYIRDVLGNILLWHFAWGFGGCTPLIADFNGGGIPELAAYYEAGGLWYIIEPRALNVRASGLVWGGAGMKAVK